MSLSVYKWGWFATAMSRAMWGWAGGKVTAGGFTPLVAVCATVFKAAPVIEKGVSVKESRRLRTTPRAPSPGLIHNMKTAAPKVSMAESGPILTSVKTNGQKLAGAGIKTMKLGRRSKRAGTVKVVNKTKKP